MGPRQALGAGALLGASPLSESSRLLGAAWLLASALLAMGCGDDGQATGAGPAGSGTGGNTAASSTGSGMQTELWASVVAESEPGQAPALAELYNDTEHILTLQVGGASFWQLTRGERTPMLLATSASVAEELRLGYHENKLPEAPCVFLTVDQLSGDSALMPGTAVQFHITGEEVEALAVNVSSTPTSTPYLGLRVRHGSTPLGLQSIEVTADGQPQLFPASVAGLTDYQPLLQNDVELGAVVLSASQTFAGSFDGALIDGAHGVTIVIGERRDDALAETLLTEQP